jgi:hypothetical protein
VYLGGFVVAEFLGDVACDSPVGVLVYGCGDEGGDVFACEFLVYEAGRCLYGGPEYPADVCAVLESEACSCGGVCYAFGDFEGYVVEEVDVFGVVDYVGVFGFEPKGRSRAFS